MSSDAFPSVLVAFALVVSLNSVGFGGDRVSVEIIAKPKAGIGPIWVTLEPEIDGIDGPVSLEWFFGDGKGSSETYPEPHLFEFGKYSVVLSVKDGKGKEYTASVTIDASSPG